MRYFIKLSIISTATMMCVIACGPSEVKQLRVVTTSTSTIPLENDHSKSVPTKHMDKTKVVIR